MSTPFTRISPHKSSFREFMLFHILFSYFFITHASLIVSKIPKMNRMFSFFILKPNDFAPNFPYCSNKKVTSLIIILSHNLLHLVKKVLSQDLLSKCLGYSLKYLASWIVSAEKTGQKTSNKSLKTRKAISFKTCKRSFDVVRKIIRLEEKI